MFVNLTTQEIIESNQVCNLLITKTFPAKTAFKLACLSKKLMAIEQIFNEIKTNTIKKYGQKDENGNIITQTLENGQVYIPIAPEYQQKCSDEILEALNQRFDIIFTPIAIEELDGELLVAEDLIAFYPFILKEEDSE